ncbi:MAG TPA: pitrilysin family protein [Gammaproteobacteria bacterium]
MNRPLHSFLHTLVIVVVLGLFTGQASATPDIQQWQTSNGARVYFVAAPQLPMVDIQVVFDAGSARDDGKSGLALLTNGLLAEGAGKLSADAIAERFDNIGARFSNSALRDMSVVSLRTLTDKKLLTAALDTFATVLQQPTFPAEALERVRNQMLIGLQDEEQSPGAIAEKSFYRALYDHHPYAAPSGGSSESVKALSRTDVENFYHRYFVTRNAVVAIVGALDRQQAERIAEQLMQKLPAGEAAPALPAVPPLAGAETLHITHPSSQTHILMGQPGMRRDDPDYFPLFVGNFILGGSGFTSRITREIREKRGLAYSAYSYFLPMREQGPFMLGLQTRNSSAAEAQQLLHDTLVSFVKEGPQESELIAAQKNITGGFALNIDSNSDIVQFLALIGFYRLPTDYLDTYVARVNSVTVAQIREAFARRIDPERMITVTVGGGR